MPGVCPGGGMLKLRFDRYIRGGYVEIMQIVSCLELMQGRNEVYGIRDHKPWDQDQ